MNAAFVGGGSTMTLNGALDTSYFAFSAKYTNGDTFFYAARGTAGRELGLGTYNSGANTITLPAASVDAIGRRLIIKSTAGIVTLAGGAVSNAVTSIAATKATEFISDGTTWNVVNVYV